MRVILVPVADRPECARALNTAFELGDQLGASIRGCHIRPHRASSVSLSSDFAAAAAWQKKNTKDAPAAAKTLYRRIAEQHGYPLIRRARVKPGALWVERVGSPEIVMQIIGPVTDLIVVSRPAKRNGVASLFLNAALMHGSGPMLMLPARGRRKIGKRVCIGWDQGPRAARTVAASIPILQHAEQVTIITCGAEDRPGPKATQLASYLAHWGVATDRVRKRGRHVEAELMDACKNAGADLLIAGAYSRNRWYEKVLGGTTEFLIHEARLPVLMQHF